MSTLHPIATIDAHNHPNGTDIRRIHDQGESVLDELDWLEQLADCN